MFTVLFFIYFMFSGHYQHRCCFIYLARYDGNTQKLANYNGWANAVKGKATRTNIPQKRKENGTCKKSTGMLTEH
jgi:hypothetical protein